MRCHILRSGTSSCRRWDVVFGPVLHGLNRILRNWHHYKARNITNIILTRGCVLGHFFGRNLLVSIHRRFSHFFISFSKMQGGRAASEFSSDRTINSCYTEGHSRKLLSKRANHLRRAPGAVWVWLLCRGVVDIFDRTDTNCTKSALNERRVSSVQTERSIRVRLKEARANSFRQARNTCGVLRVPCGFGCGAAWRC